MIQLEDLRLVHALSRHPSLSAAARALHVTPPALSTRLKRLEERMGLQLAVRSAHRLGLTPDGEALAAEAARLLADLAELPERVRSEGGALGGTVRVSAPFGFGRHHVGPLLAAFQQQHPAMQVTLDLLETPWPARRDTDLVVHIGSVRDSSWVAHPLAANERWLCAAAGYFRSRRHHPTQPRDVLALPCIAIRENEEDVTLWHVRPRDGSGRAEPLRIRPAMTTNDGEVARLWCEHGRGLVLRSEWDAAPAVAQGRLVRLLRDWDFGQAPVVALTPARSGLPARVRELLRHLQAAFQPRPPWRRH